MQSPTCPATHPSHRRLQPPVAFSIRSRGRSIHDLVLVLAWLALAGVFYAPRSSAQTPGMLDPAFDPSNFEATAVATARLAPSGHLLVGGTLAATNGLGDRVTSILLLGTNGALDTSFGVPGVATRVTALAPVPDGTVVVAGTETNGLNAVVRRLTSTGELDGTLDHTVSGTLSPWIYALTRQADGRLLAGGVFNRVDGIPRTNLFRIHSDGTIDESFRTNFNCGGGILAIHQQADGKILIGGYFTNVLGVARRGVARLNLDGTVDTSFNPGSGVQGMVRAIATQADGRVLIGGPFFSYNGTLRASLARLNVNGTLDTSFNIGAGAELSEGDASVEGPSVNAIAIQGDGRIVIAGSFQSFGGALRPNLARLEWNGAVDETFDPGAGTDGVIHSLDLDADGMLLAAGAFTTFDRTNRLGVARILNDGLLPVLPTVVTPPSDQTVTLGKPASFTVAAKGTPALRYQWLKSGLVLAGQTNDTFTLTSCQFADAGVYSVQVSNGAGTVTSASATLVVNPAPVAPVITTDPIGAVVLLGDSISMSASASGSKPLTWQWRLGSTLLDGATNDSLSLTAVTRDHAGNYTARAGNAAGSANSAVAVVSVIYPPESLTVRAGTNATLSVRSFGTGTFIYQWLFDGTPIPGATKSALTVTNASLASVGAYSVTVSNGAFGLTTPAATLAVQMPPRIDVQPADLSSAEGTTASLLITVSGSTPLAYQWRMQGTNLPGQNGATLDFNPIQPTNAGYYSVVISNAYGAVTSRIASVTVPGATVASLQIGSTTGFAGGVIELPVWIDAAGNENTASFSLAYDPALLTLEYATNGPSISAESTLLLNDTQTAAGRLGVLLAAPAGFTFDAGSNHLLTVRFKIASSLNGVTTTSVGFTNAPVPFGLLSTAVQPLAFSLHPGAVQVEAGWEADLSPDPDGDGLFTLEDLGIIAQFVAGLAAPADVRQFVRADCAPLPTRGDGFIAAADWTQAARYVAGLDSPVRSGGPQSAPGAEFSLQSVDTTEAVDSERDASRKLRPMSSSNTSRRFDLVAARTSAGGPVTVSVRLTASGSENTAGFSLAFDATQLRFVQARRGSGLGGGSSLVINDQQAAQGRLGVLIGESAGIRLRAGQHEVLAVDFDLLGDVPASLAFGDTPVLRQLVSSDVQILGATWGTTTVDPASFPVAPTPRTLIRQRSGALLMRWDATRPGHYTLESSTNLETWTPITEWDVLSAATLEFTDPDPARGSHRFYRVR